MSSKEVDDDNSTMRTRILILECKGMVQGVIIKSYKLDTIFQANFQPNHFQIIFRLSCDHLIYLRQFFFYLINLICCENWLASIQALMSEERNG